MESILSDGDLGSSYWIVVSRSRVIFSAVNTIKTFIEDIK